MENDKKSFILYTDLITVVEKLILKDRINKTNYAGELFYVILKYVNNKEVVDIDFIVELAFEPIKLSLKRDLKKFEIKKAERSESARIGNLKRWHKDIYSLFKKGEKTLEECENIIENRKSSLCDNSDTIAKENIANIAVNDSVSDNVNDSVILLKKETKRDDAFFLEISNFFSQTKESLKMRMSSVLRKLENEKKLKEFKKQTNAYIEFKKISGEKIHSWNSYQTEWENQDWIDKLNKIKKIEVKETKLGFVVN